jgi:mannose-6-phosphate isomerase-like protein (cupin superfamily)
VTTQTVDLTRLVHTTQQQGFTPLDKVGLAGQLDEGLVCPLISATLSGSTDLNVSWGRIMPGQHHLRHHHPDASEFYVVLSGEPLVHLGDTSFRAAPGAAVYIPANVIHGITNDTDRPIEMVVGMSVPARWQFVPDE